MKLFDDTQHEDDPLLEEQIEQYHVGRNADLNALRDRLVKEYPTPESAIEDYRKGYLSDANLNVRFTQEEADYIRRTKKERDEEDFTLPSGVL